MTHPLLVLLLVAACLVITLRADARSYPYQSCFEIAARLHDVPLDVLLAVAATESAWNPDARSHANAHGIMQIQWPGTARHLGVTRISELYNPCLNIELGARYLRELLDRNGGDLDRALAAYNYGPGRIEGVETLPEGAMGYVAMVDGHRTRILSSAPAVAAVPAATAAASPVPAPQTQRARVRFDHPARARGFAKTLNDRISGAEFSFEEAAEGYVVTMKEKPQGLSYQDAVLLETLGWPGAVGAP